MSPMKNRRERTQEGEGAPRAAAPRDVFGPAQGGSNLEFVRAFADALRDILRDERVHG